MQNKVRNLFENELSIVNVGLEIFTESAADQHIPCIHVDWKPGCSPELLELVEKLRDF